MERGTHPLKFVMVVVKVPSAAACTGVLCPMAVATLTPNPQGARIVGRLASLRTGAAEPFPRTGATAACPCTSRDTASKTVREAQTLDNILIQSE